jgi:hypothetical protein
MVNLLFGKIIDKNKYRINIFTKTIESNIRVVRKLQFLNKFPIKMAVFQDFRTFSPRPKTARLVRQPTGLSNKSIFWILFYIGWIGIPILILFLGGNLKWGEFQYIPKLYLWIISSAISSIAFQYLILGYIFHLIRNEYNEIIAIVITISFSLLFIKDSLGAGMIYTLNIVTMSVLLSLLLIYTNLMIPIIAFALWNITGFLLDLIVYSNYPAIVNSSISGNEIITGGIKKLEGSIIVLFVNIAAILLILYFMRYGTKTDIGKAKFRIQ